MCRKFVAQTIPNRDLCQPELSECTSTFISHPRNTPFQWVLISCVSLHSEIFNAPVYTTTSFDPLFSQCIPGEAYQLLNGIFQNSSYPSAPHNIPSPFGPKEGLVHLDPHPFGPTLKRDPPSKQEYGERSSKAQGHTMQLTRTNREDGNLVITVEINQNPQHTNIMHKRSYSYRQHRLNSATHEQIN